MATQSLKCPNCDTVVPIIHHENSLVEHSLTHHAMRTIRASEKTTHTMECRGCGAKIEVDGTSRAAECPYCGSDYVLAEREADAVIPDGVLPFQVDKNRVGELFRQWMKGRWLAPGELKHLYQKDRLQGIYVPYWTFDAKVNARYTAMGGRHRTVIRKGSDGKEMRQVVTDWYPTSGSIRHFFDDVLVPASEKMDSKLLRRTGYFGTQQIVSYASEYLSGYSAECYTVSLDDAHREAVGTMERELESMARSEVLARYDEVMDISVRANYADETYKHVLLPMYSTAYTYKGRQYRVMINGQSGRVEGDYPKSPVRIGAIILLVVMIVALVYWFSSGSNMRADTAPIWEETYGLMETTYPSQDDVIDSIDVKWRQEDGKWDYLADNLPM